MSRKLLIAFLCMSMVFTMFLPAAYADDSAAASGTFTADASQANDEAWNILASSPEKPHQFGDWMNTAEESGNGEYTIGSGKYNGADTPDYWVVTGGAPEGSEIKTFVIRARDKKYVQILGSSELEGTYTEVELLSDEADTENVCTNAYTPKRLLTYKMEGLGYRFVKIQSLATDWGGALLGKYSYTYDLLKTGEPVAQSGTYTADIYSNTDAGWNIVASSKPEQAYAFSNWISTADKGGNGEWTMGSDKYDGKDTPSYWVVTGGVPEGTEIQTFEVHAKNASCLRVWGSKTIDGEYTELFGDSGTDDGAYPSTSVYAPKMVYKYRMFKEGYKYIKIESTASNWGDAIFGIWSYTYDVPKDDPEAIVPDPTEPVDPDDPSAAGGKIEINDYKNFSTLNIVEYNGFKITKENLYLGDGTSVYHDARLECTKVGGNVYLIVEIPDGKTVDKFTIDLGRNSANDAKVYVSDKQDGVYTEVKGNLGEAVNLATNDGTQYAGSRYCISYTPARYPDLPAGTKFIKVSLPNTNDNNTYAYWLGKMAYYWGDVEYYKNDVNISASGSTCTLANVITPKYGDLDTVKLKAFCTVYDKDGKLLYMDMIEHEIGTSPWSLEFTNVPYDADYTVQLVYINNEEGFKFPLSPNLSATAQN